MFPDYRIRHVWNGQIDISQLSRLQSQYEALLRKENTMSQSNKLKLEIINAAIEAGDAVEFDYTDAIGNLSRSRVVDLNSIATTKSGSEVKGYCRTRSEPRTFLLKSMENVKKYVITRTVKVGDRLRFSDGDELLVVYTDDGSIRLIHLPTAREWSSCSVKVKSFKERVPLKQLIGTSFPETSFTSI